jgi:Ion channel
LTVLATAAGLALIALAVRDVFDTLFHPHGRGVVSEALTRATWRGFHAIARGRHQVLSYAGPTAFLLVVLSWVALVVLGFALIILPHLPEEYVLARGLSPDATSGFVDAIYVSMVSMTSLGFGDVAAEGDVLRLLGPVETMIGLGILTASISWILSIYGVLSDYRSASHEIALLREAERKTEIRLGRADPSEAARLLAALTSRLVAARRDLLHFPIAYYFHTRDPHHALSTQLPALLDLVNDASAEGRSSGLRLEATRLRLAVEDFLETIDDEFLTGGRLSTSETLAAYQRDHLRAVPP